MNEAMKRATKESLLARAQAHRESKTKYLEYSCQELGETIMIKKLPLERVCSMLDMAEGSTAKEGLEFNKDLIYEHVPLFQDRELQEACGCNEPHDVVTAILDENMGEIDRMAKAIMSMYGIEEAAEDIKN
ncbi:MAG: hypothetical protein ACI4WY_07405 [Anaerovoracaceae bacterium]